MTRVPSRLLALNNARKWVGTGEHPPGSNHGPQVDRWQRRAAGATGFPWCACFLWCMFDDAGRKLQIQFPASVLSWVETAVPGTPFHRVSRPLRGDVVAYSWDGHTPRPDDHIGIVEKVLALPRMGRKRYWIKTVEGNTGDAVRRRWRWVDPRDVVFLRIEGV